MTLPVGTVVTTRSNLHTHYASHTGKVVLVNHDEYGVCFGKGNKVAAWFLESELVPYIPKFNPKISFSRSE